ncbi:hypothetical protein SteCoe_33056 [Stentor coeruleus]|uniref:Uncharacterized protein n=1 Tax=Stentor coeruleus TaxID=5963 RepID=A0A1R2AXL7_9CILI|nr:hypothetical protein SteCoe_33056 [Stentor coeruleus]
MSRLGPFKNHFYSPLIQQITSEMLFSGTGHFSITCCVSILETLIRYSMQPSLKVYNHIKQAFESYMQYIQIYANNYNNQQEINYFFDIFNQLISNERTLVDKLKLLHGYVKNPCENYKRGLEKGMKFLIAGLFGNDIETINAILFNNEAQKLGQIFMKLSDYFRIKFIVLERDQIKEYMPITEDIPIVFVKYIIRESSVLYTEDMNEIENSVYFNPKKLEEFPFMDKRYSNQGYAGLNPGSKISDFYSGSNNISQWNSHLSNISFNNNNLISERNTSYPNYNYNRRNPDYNCGVQANMTNVPYEKLINPTAGKQICDYERKYITKEKFGIVKCSENCRICNECRAENIDQCVICEGYYSENQKNALIAIRDSFRNI